MGRKADFNKKKKTGPGRKAKKQQPPVFRNFDDEKEKILSSNQKKRAKKRTLKQEDRVLQKSKKQKVDNDVKTPEEPEESKKLLFASDSEDESELELPSDSDHETFEEKSKKLADEEQERDEAVMKDMETMKENVSLEIPSLEEVKTELEQNPEMVNLKSWIKDITFILSDFKNRSNGRKRSELVAILKACLCNYYSYNEWLLENLMSLFTISDFLDFLDANEAPRPVTLRSNSLKIRRKDLLKSLLNQGIDIQTLNWTDVGLIVYKSNIALGATVEYFTGQYIIQGASSYLSVIALNPQPNEVVLDMCSAPGGKSTHIAAVMRNTGIVCSNDSKKDRTKALVGNFHRLGVKNAVITNIDGRKFGKKMPNRFDRVLLDAPCSGTGVIWKDPNVKCSKTGKDVQRKSLMQRELLLSAIDSVNARSRTGGYIVYSTCSLLVAENEAVVDYALRKRNIKCVPTDLEIGEAGFVNYCGKSYNKDLKNCKRIYPHLHNMDGFFVALLKKSA